MVIFFSTCLIFLSIFCFQTSYCDNYEGPIAGNKSISDCTTGGTKKYSDTDDMTTLEKIIQEGYPGEEHVVATEDGFLLTLHRIKGLTGSPTAFLQHGLLASSYDWVFSGKNKSLAFLLADQGYDVWLGNCRGSLYSRCYIDRNASKESIWDFSFHENGIYDLPAAIEYVTNMKNDELIYVGHSMGTTMFYIMATERPDIASKVKVMLGLAPAAFLYNTVSPIRYLVPFVPILARIINFITEGEIFIQTEAWKIFSYYFCDLFYIERVMCVGFTNIFVGFDSAQTNYTLTPALFNHYPTGTSLKTLLHFAQYIKKNEFRQYDYGSDKNLQLYNSEEPPNYDLSKMQVPIALFWGENDYLVTEKDVDHLYDLIPNKILNYKVDYSKFNHFDFVYAIDAPKLLYSKVMYVMEKYR